MSDWNVGWMVRKMVDRLSVRGGVRLCVCVCVSICPFFHYLLLTLRKCQKALLLSLETTASFFPFSHYIILYKMGSLNQAIWLVPYCCIMSVYITAMTSNQFAEFRITLTLTISNSIVHWSLKMLIDREGGNVVFPGVSKMIERSSGH